ncbi:uncharacterized protein MELLADRAFT_117679 [Melampsora larici-populina 98AG31]|uniref:Uncharacterized protein n=1 Tax=Melampsora larici-populina (strain 98AG31 / pathotype 3-4-7) TaxID=747676 RepID=F4S0B5_MELLP|nr:uncharacterized protein MELLADRAFT_117679 [Melampsora larici-populina 98AG31]EGG01967.1 hypothetical protein MELLADRAFT_117679 [Melampsora larici-populina 98AG31]
MLKASKYGLLASPFFIFTAASGSFQPEHLAEKWNSASVQTATEGHLNSLETPPNLKSDVLEVVVPGTLLTTSRLLTERIAIDSFHSRAQSEPRLSLRTKRTTNQRSKNVTNLARRASGAPHVAHSALSTSTADSQDTPDADNDNDSDTNTNSSPRVTTSASGPTPTPMGSSRSSNSTSSSQATRSRGTPTSSASLASHATATSAASPSASPSAPQTAPTFGDLFSHLNSYFQPSNGAFPLAIMITVAAAILLLLVIISVAKCICHRPKFANAKDYPQGFPWESNNPNRPSDVKHKRTPSSPFSKSAEGNWSKMDNEKSLQTNHELNSWQPDPSLSHSSHVQVAPSPLQLSETANVQRTSPAPFSVTFEPQEGWTQNPPVLHSPARSSGFVFPAQPSPTSYDPLRAQSPYHEHQSSGHSDYHDRAPSPNQHASGHIKTSATVTAPRYPGWVGV